jgi:hypothetical protein
MLWLKLHVLEVREHEPDLEHQGKPDDAADVECKDIHSITHCDQIIECVGH